MILIGYMRHVRALRESKDESVLFSYSSPWHEFGVLRVPPRFFRFFQRITQEECL
jgi:hypothetical protein